jgi:hypothetical protein
MTEILETIADLGDRWRLGNHAASGKDAFTSLGTATDPTAVTLTLERPDGTQVVWAWPTPGAGQSTLTKETEQTGRFYGEHTWDQVGLHWCRLVGTGTVTATAEWGIVVRARRVEG